jgi:hypothetical protein
MSAATTNFVQTLSEGIHVKRPANDPKAVESFTFAGETAIAAQLGVASHLALALKSAGVLVVSPVARPVLQEALEDFIRSRATQCEVIRLRREANTESTQTWTAASTTNASEIALSFDTQPSAAAPKKRKPKSKRGSSRRQRAANDR